MALDKISLINGAYSQMRISGITMSAEDEDNELALDRMEDLASTLEAQGITINYNFEDDPLLTSLHNLERKYRQPFKTWLAVWLLPDFDKKLTVELSLLYKASVNFLINDTTKIKPVAYPRRMPIGSGTENRQDRYRRFMPLAESAPVSPKTNIMYIGDKAPFVEPFLAWLNSGETISSYVLTAESTLVVTNEANNSTNISYTVEAKGNPTGTASALSQVKIVATTSEGRVETRIIDFELKNSEIDNE